MQNVDRIIAEITVKAWSDSEFAQRLEADTASVLREHGIDPSSVDFVLPSRPVMESESLTAGGKVVITGSYSIIDPGTDPRVSFGCFSSGDPDPIEPPSVSAAAGKVVIMGCYSSGDPSPAETGVSFSCYSIGEPDPISPPRP